MIGIVWSRADEASEHVCEHLLELGDFEERTDDARPDADGGGTYHSTRAFSLRSFDDLHLELDGVADAFDDPEYVVFASRHAGDTGPLLSAHVTGNFGEAEYGGADRELARAPPNALATVLDRLAEHAPEGYDVAMECTHHGPTDVGAPSTFVELGSAEAQWADPEAARAVARAILDLAGVPASAPPERRPAAIGDREARDDPSTDAGTEPPAGDGADASTGPPNEDDPDASIDPDADPERRHLVGFGGGHYAPRFTRLARETDWCVGHVAADWSLAELGDPGEHRDVVEQAFERSDAGIAVVEGERPSLEATIEALGYRVASETWVRETASVPLWLVDAATERLLGVDAGLRFGEPARVADAERRAAGLSQSAVPAFDLDDLAVVDLPEDLLATTQGIDREAVLDALDRTCVAYATEEGGARAGGRALVVDGGAAGAIPSEGALPLELRAELVSLLQWRFDEVAVEDDRAVATETAFDPELARAAGVPEGPKFGLLSDGEPVNVDGETVAPEDVTAERRETFDL